jgi:anti-sigma factor RsiW
VSLVCEEVQRHLPALVRGEVGRPRAGLLRRHVRGCRACAAELARQEEVQAGLAALAAGGPDEAPPPGLLEDLLDATSSPGLAGRAAVPARGAVSGARPGLSLALLVVGAAAGTGAGWAGWRAVRAVRRRR